MCETVYNGDMSESARKNHVFWWVLLVLLAVVVVVGALNWRWCYDFIRGMGYSATGEMGGIVGRLDLTDRGEFLFRASRPELLGRDEFNSHCVEGESETAVLGCYTKDTVYVYDITDKELFDSLYQSIITQCQKSEYYKKYPEDPSKRNMNTVKYLIDKK